MERETTSHYMVQKAMNEELLEQIIKNQNKMEQQITYLYKMLTIAGDFLFPFKMSDLDKPHQQQALQQFQEIKGKNNIIDLSRCDSPNPASFKTIHRNVTLTAEPFFNFTDGKRGQELLAVHDGKFSAIKFGIIDAQNKGISFKIKFGEELESFLARSRYALDKAIRFKGSNQNDQYADAYKPLKLGKYKGETPAAMLFAGKEKELIGHRNFMEQNLSRYPKNVSAIQNIDKAIKWYHEGKLENKQNNKVIIYHRPLWVNPHKQRGEKYYMSQQRITYLFGEKYPCSIEAMDGFGYTVMSGKLRVVDKNRLKEMEDRKSVSINLTEPEFRDLIEQITTIKNTAAMLRIVQTLYLTLMMQMASQQVYEKNTTKKP